MELLDMLDAEMRDRVFAIVADQLDPEEKEKLRKEFVASLKEVTESLERIEMLLEKLG